jgi:hypothetical protein
MQVPGLGEVTADERFGWYYSEPLSIPMFGGRRCRIVLDGYQLASRERRTAHFPNFTESLSPNPVSSSSVERRIGLTGPKPNLSYGGDPA